MIKLHNIEKSFRSGAGETFVLRRIHAEVGKGEFVTIMGPSGAGKSTLLAILGMLDGDWRGEYYLMGEPVHAMKPRARIELNKRYVGFVFQQYHLIDDLNVYENLEIPLSYRNVRRKERQAIVADTLDRFQIVGKKDLYPSQLSGGQQQMVAVARAVIAEPDGDPRRRAHRKPALEPGPDDHGPPQAAQSRGHHDRPGHAQRGIRRRTETASSSSRTAGSSRSRA